MAVRSILLFALAALAEIGGAYLVWLGIKEHKGVAFVALGAMALAAYGMLAAFQPSNEFGRVLAAYGGEVQAMTLEGAMPQEIDGALEAWGMAIAWTGFPFAKLVEFARPLGSAKYVRMETFMNPKIAPGQKQPWFPWPYVEGLTMAEATNELTFLATGAYGHPLARQHGAPLRLAVPWKYGFKSIKSIVRFSFTDTRPKGLWEALQASEYGFWANVNPEVPHPRWSQATEEIIGTGERRPTLLFNGYGDYVAGLYKSLENERLWA